MDGFQFVFESPQATQNHKKRPRLVTSCDNCRLKKIKCLQAAPDAKCEACSQAKVSCRFRDRERYFVERSRVMASPGPRPPCSDHTNCKSVHSLQQQPGAPHDELFMPLDGSTFNDFMTPSTTPGSYLGHCRNQSFPSDPVRSLGKTRHTQAHSAPPSPTLNLLDQTSPFSSSLWSTDSEFSNQPFPIFNEQSIPVPLFDFDQPQYPHRSLMPHYIQIFTQHLGMKCPFITYYDTLERFSRGILPPLLSSSIAALAARFSDHPALISQGLDVIAEGYREAAKTILPTVMYPPSMETMHALMLLAWLEYDNGQLSTFRSYAETAMRMALQLGLSADPALRLNINESGRNLLRVTWSSVVQLNLLASQCA